MVWEGCVDPDSRHPADSQLASRWTHFVHTTCFQDQPKVDTIKISWWEIMDTGWGLGGCSGATWVGERLAASPKLTLAVQGSLRPVRAPRMAVSS